MSKVKRLTPDQMDTIYLEADLFGASEDDARYMVNVYLSMGFHFDEIVSMIRENGAAIFAALPEYLAD